MASSTHQVSRLLRTWAAGNQQALPELIPLVYAELHRMARRYMSHERRDHTLQTTALVNEAYVRLVESPQPEWRDRTYFFAVCANVMRRILVDWARSHQAIKRGRGVAALQLNEAVVAGGQYAGDLLALDEALHKLAQADPRKARVVELRYFGGLDVHQTAEVLKVSPETVMRDWRFAKSWLWRELSGAERVRPQSTGPGCSMSG